MSTPTPSDSRKRLRSESCTSSTSAASSPKRAASDSPATPGNAKSPLAGQSSVLAHDMDTDREMVSQGQGLSLSDGPTPGSSTVSALTPTQKLDEIEALRKQPLKLGDTWYIVSRTWYRNWVSACGGAPVKGAPESESQITAVDNTSIAGTRPGSLNGDSLVEGVNIELLPQAAWDLLVSWYGQPTHTFGRKVIAEGVHASLRIEFYPTAVLLYMCRAKDPPPPERIEFTKSLSLFDLQKAYVLPLCQKYGEKSSFRCWKIDPTDLLQDDDEKQGYTPQRVMASNAAYLFGFVNRGIDSKKVTVDDALICDGDRLIVEIHDPDSYLVFPGGAEKRPYWHFEEPAQLPEAPQVVRTESQRPLFTGNSDFFTKLEASTVKPFSSTTAESSRSADKISTALVPVSMKLRSPQPQRTRGTMGLNNLGNTCYMNSALQCLTHLPELTEYFLSGAFLRELNPNNPLSTGGELAKSYGSLLQSLFEANSSFSVAPRDFKMKIARHNATFSGYMQHDTQELLAFLLDGLHEDLNRIQKKPYVENPDWEGGAELELCKLARDFWTGYRKRNDSVIVDLFQGQYQSTLVCPECQKVSITFDPFMYLTLPLPVQKSWEHEFYFVTWDTARPNYKTRVLIPSTSTIREVKELLSRWFNSNPDNLLVADIFQSRIYKFLPDYQSVTEILETDTMFVYELPISAARASSRKPSSNDPFILPVWTVSPSFSGYAGRFTSSKFSKEVWGFPFFVAIRPEDAGSEEAIYNALVSRYEQATNKSKDLYQWEEPEADTVMVTAPTTQDSEGDGELVERPKEDEATATTMESDPFDDLEEVKLPSYMDSVEEATSSTPSSSFIKVGPKPELFTWYVMEDNFDPSRGIHNGSAYDSGRVADLIQRMADAENGAPGSSTDNAAESSSPTFPGFLRPGDAIVCDWDTNVQHFYFGYKGVGHESRWNLTEDYVDEEQKAKQVAQSARIRGGITIDDCLDEFVKEEKLGEADPWYCPRCKKHQQATKKFDIWTLPDILVIHLKRFSSSRMLRDKIDAPVDFPVEGLDLSGRVAQRAAAQALKAEGVDLVGLGILDLDEPLAYDLFAVDEHMGGLGGGHYRAYAKNGEDEKWYHFDDSLVDVVDAKSVVTPMAYVLFYRRRTTTSVGGQTVTKIEEARSAEESPVPEADAVTEEPVPDVTHLHGFQHLTPPEEATALPLMDDDDPFPPSISQMGSPRSSIAAPTTPEREGKPEGTGRYRQYESEAYGASPIFRSASEIQGDDIETANVVVEKYSGVIPERLRVDEDYDGLHERDEPADEILLDNPDDLTTGGSAHKA